MHPFSHRHLYQDRRMKTVRYCYKEGKNCTKVPNFLSSYAFPVAREGLIPVQLSIG